MAYEPIPSPEELQEIGVILGQPVAFDRRIAGGQSATTDVLVRRDGARVVLRRHGRWTIRFDNTIAARESAVLGAIAACGVPAPAVLWSGQFGATSATITVFIDGLGVIQPNDPFRWASQLATTLATIHSIAVEPELAVILAQAPPQQVDTDMPALFFEHPRGSALVKRRSALKPRMPFPTRLVHGDYWPGNLLWRDGEIVAVLDWEAAAVDDPAGDVAYCYAEMRYLGLDEAADHFVATYRLASGAELPSLPYWIVTALCRAVPYLHKYLDGWSSLGYKPDSEDVRRRLNRLIEESLDA